MAWAPAFTLLRTSVVQYSKVAHRTNCPSGTANFHCCGFVFSICVGLTLSSERKSNRGMSHSGWREEDGPDLENYIEVGGSF